MASNRGSARRRWYLRLGLSVVLKRSSCDRLRPGRHTVANDVG